MSKKYDPQKLRAFRATALFNDNGVPLFSWHFKFKNKDTLLLIGFSRNDLPVLKVTEVWPKMPK